MSEFATVDRRATEVDPLSPHRIVRELAKFEDAFKAKHGAARLAELRRTCRFRPRLAEDGRRITFDVSPLSDAELAEQAHRRSHGSLRERALFLDSLTRR